MTMDPQYSALDWQWPDRLRRAAIILLVAAQMLVVVVSIGEMSAAWAVAVFFCITAAALIPWRLQDGVTSAEDGSGADPIDAMAVAAVLAAMPDPVVLLDRAGRVLHLNAAAARLAPALRRNEPAQFALRSPEIIAALRAAIATAQESRTAYLNHGALQRWMELIIAPVRMPTPFGGIHKCLLLTFHDKTEVMRVEEMRADFVANASHELRTPLAALSGFIETLQGPAKDDPSARARFLGIMQTQAARMACLINDLLSLSRVELHAHVRPETRVDLVSIVHQVVEGLEPLTRERQVEIDTDLPEEAILITGDREELLRLVENLVENALKYGASGGRVRVSLKTSAPEIHVVVRDFGPGIAPEHLPRLTERFYRVDLGDSRSQGGTGLGLALVKHILNRHGGRLLIESELHKGATFTACFPEIDAS
ncbi:MAG: ATP-binding protein [Alphaproteobacteria bacterium]|nr:ATP-binding protein [Alphaproteobacteria bacterium]